MSTPTLEGFRLSPQQERLWSLHAAAGTGAGAALAARAAVAVAPGPSPAALRRGMRRVVDGFEVLRTHYPVPEGMRLPVQAILDTVEVELPRVDLAGLPGAGRRREARRLLASQAPPAPETAEPAWSVRLVELGEGRRDLHLALPAFAADRASLGLLRAELQAAWGGAAVEEPMQYADVAEWQQGLLEADETRSGADHWRRLGARHELRPAFAEGEPFRPRRARVTLGKAEAGAIDALAEASGSSPEAVVLAAWMVVLDRHGEEVAGSLSVLCAGRAYEGLDTVVGPMARHVPLVLPDSALPDSALSDPASPDPASPDLPAGRRHRSFAELARAVAEAWREAREWQEYFSWEALLGDAGEHGRAPFLPYAFEAVEGAAGASPEDDAVVERFAQRLVWSRGEAGARLEAGWDGARGGGATALARLGQVRAVLAAAAASPDRPVGELADLTGAEAHRLGLEVNDTGRPLPRTGRLLHELFLEQARRTPGAVAVTAGEGRAAESLTYAELERRSAAVARALADLGVGPDVRVALCAQRSLEMVEGMLGILRAGGAYVPLDPGYPAGRLAYMVADSAAAVVLTGGGAVELPPEAEARALGVVEARRRGGELEGPLPGSLPDAAAAYVIYTSGSTGRPKGAVIPHAAIVSHMRWMDRRLPLAEGDAVLQKTPLSFDASVWEFHAPLMAGARLVLAPPGAHREPARLLQLCAEHRVTVLQVVPSLLRVLLDEPAFTPELPLRRVLCGGEALAADLVGRFAARSGAELHNVYGPAEATIHATTWRCPPRRPRAVAIGRPLDRVQVHVAGAAGRRVPVGVAGELLIAGAGLGRGYLARPALTADRWRPNPWGGPGERIYRTGDLARWRSDGELEFLGRVDRQVKLRGQRIELGEIEAALAGLDEVAAVAVLLREDTPGDARVTAYLVPAPGATADTADLAARLAAHLPEHMVPGAWALLDELPLSPSGKVDRRALAAQPPPQAEADPGAAPRTPSQEIIADIWAQVLGLDRVGVDQAFFDLGGHSLLATRVIARVRDLLGVDLPVRALFEAGTVEELARRADAARAAAGEDGAAAAAPPLVPVGRDRDLPLSFAQSRLWFLHRLEPGSGFYNAPVGLRLAGPLRPGVLRRALEGVVRRHEVLRTAITERGGEPRQEVRARAAVALPVVDLSALPEERREARASALAGAEAGRPFDLATAPHLRALLLRLADRDHGLLLTLHHVVSDEWSLGVFWREAASLYRALAAGEAAKLPELPELPVQYADFAVWQRGWLAGDRLRQELDWWRGTLAGAPPRLELPTDRPRPAVPGHRGAHLRFEVGGEVAAALRKTARGEGATLFMVLLAAFQALLARLSGQDDVVVGTPVAGRTHRELEPLIGFFANTLALRGDLSGDPGFRDLLARVRRACLDAYAHQDLPFELLVDEVAPQRSLSEAPIFQALFTLQNPAAQEGPEAVALPGLSVRGMAVESGSAKFDLTLAVADTGDGLRGLLEYDRDLFEAATARRMAELYRRLLAAVVAEPARPLSRLPLATPEERDQLLAEGRPGVDGGVVGAASSLLAELWRRAEAAPGQPAVELRTGNGEQAAETVTYGELRHRVGALSRRLAGLGAGPEVRVAILAQRRPETVVAMLAALAAGAPWVCLDPASPPERLAGLLADSGARVVVAPAGALPGELPRGVAGLELGAGDGAGGVGGADGGLTSPVRGLPAAAAYVCYTSGSSGRPKGVVVPRGALAARVPAMVERYGLQVGDRVLQYVPFAFDAAVEEVFPTLLAGATLVLHPDPTGTDPAELLTWCGGAGVTTLHHHSSLLRYFADAVALGAATLPASLRRVVAGGERFPVEALGELLAGDAGAGSPLRVFNVYGPTEATVTALVAEAPGSPGPLGRLARMPVGRPLAGSRVYVVDVGGATVPPGVPGELWIGGGAVARGYLGRPAATAAAFTPDPFSGEAGSRLYRTGDRVRWLPAEADGAGEADAAGGRQLDFLGRLDDQLKVRGLRLEPQEVEVAYLAHAAVAEAAAVMHRDESGERLVLFYRPAEAADADVDDADLHATAGRRLPPAALAQRLVPLPALPRTATGKLDRRALAATPLPEGAAAAPPRGGVEELLAGVWRRLLGVDEVSRDDGFFALGGHSLLATQLVSRVRDALGVELPLKAIFEAPALSTLARRVEEMRREGKSGPAATPLPEPPPLEALPDGAKAPLSFAQERLWFLDRLEPETAVYNVPAAWRVQGELEPRAVEWALGEIVRRHAILRTRFDAGDDGPVQVVAPAGTFRLPTLDLSPLPGEGPLELARELAREEMLRPFDLAAGPLLRLRLLRLGAADHVLLATFHHTAVDGWSMGVLVSELERLYAAHRAGEPSPLDDLPVQYADFAAWQRRWLEGDGSQGAGSAVQAGDDSPLQRQLDWWRHLLGEDPPPLELPTDRPRPAVARFRGGRRPLRLDAAELAAVERFARQAGATPFMVLLAAFHALLARLSGQDRVLVGTDVANRERRELEALVGLFVNQLVLPADLSGSTTFGDLASRVRDTALGAFAHQSLPFERLVDALVESRDLSRNPLFQAAFTYLEQPALDGARLPGLEVRPLGADVPLAKFDLSLHLAATGGGRASGALEYDRDLFDATTAERMARWYRRLLAAMLEAPQRPLADLPLLAPAQRHQLLREWSDTAESFPGEAGYHELFRRQAEATPEAVAAADGAGELTYGKLLRRSERWAGHLAAAGALPGAVVGLHLARGLDLLTAILATFRTGAAYLPLDVAHPPARLATLLADSGAVAVVGAEPGGEAAAALDAALELVAGEGAAVARTSPAGLDADPPAPAPAVEVTGGHRAYVLYTSGSTGRPKGAMVRQRGMLNHLFSKIRELGLGTGDRVAATAPPSFDISVWQQLAALLAGGRVELVPGDVVMDGGALLLAFEERRVTVAQLVPSLLAAVLDAADAGDVTPPPLGRLRWLTTIGEALPVELARRWLERYPAVPLVNGYGPTECSDQVSRHVLARPPAEGETRVPIGRPAQNTVLRVTGPLAGGLQPRPHGVPGEVMIGGAGVGLGYLGDPRRTAATFVPDPHSPRPGARLYRTGDRGRWLAGGELEFLGRFDHQVKVRGFRIEPGEVEAALESHPGVARAVVVARDEGAAGAFLAAFWEPLAEAQADAPGLASHLGDRLPAHMVPAVIELVPELPLNANGKVDRRELARRPLTAGRPEGAAGGSPRTALEEVLVGLYSDLLGRPDVGPEDDFFALGGHSLLATRLASRVRRGLGAELPLRAVFEAPTARALARRVEEARGGAAPTPPVLPVGRDRDLPLSHGQRRLWFHQQVEPLSGLYNVPLALRLGGALSAPALARALAAIEERHEVLRTVFPRSQGEPVQRVLPPPAPHLPRVDLGRLVSGRAAAEARRLAAAEARRPFDLATAGPLRKTLLRLAPEEHLLLLTLHHVASDGWSLEILRGELAALYAAGTAGGRAELPELPVQYADYAVWQRRRLDGGVLEAHLEWWRRRLEGAPPLLEVPTDRPRPRHRDFRGAREAVAFGGRRTAAVRELARAEAATPFMVVLAAFQALLSRLTGQHDVVVGTPVAGRDRAELEGLIGFFVNNLVLRTDLSGDPTFREILARARETALGAYSHQDVPFEAVLEELAPERDPSHAPLFQVLLAMDRRSGRVGGGAGGGVPGLEVEVAGDAAASSKFDFAILLSEEGDEIRGSVEYATALYDAATVGRVVEQLDALLEQVLADPELRLSQIRLLSEEETAGLAPEDFPEAELSRGELEDLLQELGEVS